MIVIAMTIITIICMVIKYVFSNKFTNLKDDVDNQDNCKRAHNKSSYECTTVLAQHKNIKEKDL